jgi:type IV pilus assembly protein PilW
MHASQRARQSGFSLTELMIAVSIGLVLTVVISQVFLGNQASFRTQDDASRIAENARFAQMVLNRTIRNMGFVYWNDGTTFKQAWAGKTQLAAVNASGPNGSDEITVSFYGSSVTPGGAADGTVISCNGETVNDNTTVNPTTNRFYVATGADGRNSLFCDSRVAGGTLVSRELVSGVETFQVLYGEDKSKDYTPDHWVPAGTAGLDLTQVVGVRIGLVLSSPNIGTTTQADTTTYHVFGADYPLEGADTGTAFTPATADRSRLRKLYSYNIALRNKVQ